jgi:2-(1,2-epoxy-1,2-dihydrophenyl)acetyl-CoA isomerase
MAYECILLEKENGIATITLNRPDRMNALNAQLLEEFADAIKGVGADDEVRVLILTGAGRGFCTGMDVEVVASGGMEAPNRNIRTQPLSQLGWAGLVLYNLGKPTIAAVNGTTAGAGLSFALACDMRIAAESARFSSVFIRRALTPDTGATFLLPRIVGTAKALEMMYTGEMISASEAERIGLVSKVVPDEELIKTVKELAAKMAKMSPLALELTKKEVLKGLRNDFEAQLGYEAWAQSVLTQSEDIKEGMNAFLEKREPHFKGR